MRLDTLTHTFTCEQTHMHTHDVAQMTDEKRAFSVDEVAEMLDIGRTAVYRILNSGELDSKKIGGSRRIFLSDLEDYLGEERAHSLVKDLNAADE